MKERMIVAGVARIVRRLVLAAVLVATAAMLLAPARGDPTSAERTAAARGVPERVAGRRHHAAYGGVPITRPTGFEPVTSCSGGKRSIH
jgi:hypothetical protein